MKEDADKLIRKNIHILYRKTGKLNLYVNFNKNKPLDMYRLLEELNTIRLQLDETWKNTLYLE
jgi:hypothetical protein